MRTHAIRPMKKGTSVTEPVDAEKNAGRTTAIVGISVAVFLAAAMAVAAMRGPQPAAPNVPETQAESTATPAAPTEVVSGTPEATAAPTAPAPGAQAPAPGVSSAATSTPIPGDIARPKAPAPDGSKLESLSAPPVKTIGMISVPDGFRVATYAVTMRPFGWGPRGSEGGRLVVAIVKSTPTDEGARALGKEFSGRNATVWVTAEQAEAIKLGGTYAGTIVLSPQGGGTAAFRLVDAELAK